MKAGKGYYYIRMKSDHYIFGTGDQEIVQKYLSLERARNAKEKLEKIYGKETLEIVGPMKLKEMWEGEKEEELTAIE